MVQLSRPFTGGNRLSLMRSTCKLLATDNLELWPLESQNIHFLTISIQDGVLKNKAMATYKGVSPYILTELTSHLASKSASQPSNAPAIDAQCSTVFNSWVKENNCN